jgi:3-oxoacyl-[acyl-carrier-protein] synthase-1
MSGAPLILGAACAFPSGPSLELADAAVRSQLSLLQYHPIYRDCAGSAPRISCFPDASAFDASRWHVLARHALAQLTQALIPQWHALHTAPRLLWLVLPDAARPGMPPGLVEQVGAAVQHELWPWQHIHLVCGGHAAGIAALVAARQALHAQPDALAVVLAVEAGLGHEALHWLDLQGLLHGASTPLHGQLRRNAYGRVPGEGAAAIALGASVQLAPASWARLLGCATALEPVTHTSPRPCTGLGLTQAARQAIEQARAHSPAPVGQLIADLNGEPYRADQFGFAALRLGRAFTPDWQRSVPALASGDLHSASALAHVALAAYGQWRRPQGTHILVLASSDDTLRGAAVLGASQPTRNLPEIRAWRSPSTSTA